MCTGIFIKTKDGKYIFGRTLEFGVFLKWKQICNKDLVGTKGNFQGFKEWFMTDGLNKHGLFIGTFFFPHYDDQYAKKTDCDKINVETGYVNEFLLLNCKTVEDVKNMAPMLNIMETKLKDELFSLHWMVCDKNGNCIVLEVKQRHVRVYENPYHVITNSPTFPEQERHVKKYDYLSKYNTTESMSQGSGALGMPGDSTSLSRFVRAHFFRKNMVVPENAKTGINAVLRILHNFDIPLGSVEEKATGAKEVTEYTVAYNLNTQNVKYAPYGYVLNKNGDWKQTENPVKLCK